MYRGRLRAQGRDFVDEDGTWFDYRGITAFRLVEFVADGRDVEADAYLDFCALHGLTPRVLAMSAIVVNGKPDGPFDLTPAEGLAVLPLLLQRAKDRGVYVEVVALAVTKAYPDLDILGHLRAVAAICHAAGNALLEGANEPGHGTQTDTVDDLVDRFATMRPAGLLYSPGAPGLDELPTHADGTPQPAPQHSGGDYLTPHNQRDHDEWGWRWVRHTKDTGDMARWLNEPVVSDEPIGADELFHAGKRDNDPARWFAFGCQLRANSLYGTFHYGKGVRDCTIPTGRTMECLQGWLDGLETIPWGWKFDNSGHGHTPIGDLDWTKIVRLVTATQGNKGFGLALGLVDPNLPLSFQHGWRRVAVMADRAAINRDPGSDPPTRVQVFSMER